MQSNVDYHILHHSQGTLVRGTSSTVGFLPPGGTLGPYSHHWPVLHAAPDLQLREHIVANMQSNAD